MSQPNQNTAQRIAIATPTAAQTAATAANPLTVEIDRVLSTIAARESELTGLRSILSTVYAKLGQATKGLAASALVAVEEGKFYVWPDGSRKPVSRGRPPKGAKVVTFKLAH